MISHKEAKEGRLAKPVTSNIINKGRWQLELNDALVTSSEDFFELLLKQFLHLPDIPLDSPISVIPPKIVFNSTQYNKKQWATRASAKDAIYSDAALRPNLGVIIALCGFFSLALP